MTFSAKDILTLEVAPALGCTEPVAIALGAAAAASLVPGQPIDRIEIWLDPNIYKNGLAVVIPGSGGLQGLDMAAAIGAFGGKAELKLEVLSPVSQSALEQAKSFVKARRVQVNLLTERKGLYIRTVITGRQDTAESEIVDMHDNLVKLALNGDPLVPHPLLDDQQGPSPAKHRGSLEAWLKERSLGELIALLDELDPEDLDFIEEGLRINLRLAESGLASGSGLGVGTTLERLVRKKLIQKDMILDARILTSAAADARMAGVNLPAMSSAGSGNHGLTAILPLQAVHQYIGCGHDTLLRGIALSHMITAYIKAFTGRLSAVCGCSVAAGAGASAGVAYLLGGDIHHIAGAIKNLMEDLAGVICDGAKAACAFKLATAAGNAVQAALFSLHGVNVASTDGIVGESPEQTMRNIGTLSTEGMIETDRTILKIMMAKKFSAAG